MTINAIELSIIVPAFIAGILVTATHVPLGMQVLSRGIVFIDLAIAQIAGVGVMLAASLGFEPEGWAVQIAAFSAAFLGALLLTWTEKKYPEVQEAIIGVIFILAATAGVILLAGNVHANENLRDLLVGQILWVRASHLPLEALIYAAILSVWFGFRERIGRTGFYLLFACAVTVSVQLVGLYLVFSSLIIPPLATRHIKRYRLAISYCVGAIGYGIGLGLSVMLDLPSGPVVVWALAVAGIVVHAFSSPRGQSPNESKKLGNWP
jgi:zinc/manganese transport system permease protein